MFVSCLNSDTVVISDIADVTGSPKEFTENLAKYLSDSLTGQESESSTTEPPRQFLYQLKKEFDQDRFRKASLNMVLATLAAEKAIRLCAPSLPEGYLSSCGMVFATRFGEVQSSLDFLQSYQKTKVLKPILFQNSLHNSTLGFASIQLGIKGAGLTISSGSELFQSIVEGARALLFLHEYLIICIADFLPWELKTHYLRVFPHAEKYVDRAQVFILKRNLVNDSSAMSSNKTKLEIQSGFSNILLSEGDAQNSDAVNLGFNWTLESFEKLVAKCST